MTIHLCRDFLTLPSSSVFGTSIYLTSIFLQHVMSFDVDSQWNFDINSSSFTLDHYNVDGNDPRFASINILSGSEYVVYLPSGTYDASSYDIDRILALRSSLFPQHNSGLFRITSSSFHPTYGTGFTIDYRSSEVPPVESGSIAWRLYEAESRVTGSWMSGSNGGYGYNSRGLAQNTRIMLNSPSGYHVRLCIESIPDRSGTIPCGFSIAPGAGSIERADFDDVEGFLHGPMWFNSTSSIYKGTAVGLVPYTTGTNSEQGQWRFTAIGDTTKSSIVLLTKNVNFVTGGNGLCVFGLPEDEEEPLPQKIIDRLFIVGYGGALPNVTWHSGFLNDGHATGLAWSRYGFPAPLVMSSYADIKNVDPHVRLLSTANNTPFIGLTELVDVELLCGTMSSSFAHMTSSITSLAPRRVGRLPLLRQGRANYTQWALTPDKKWLHTLDGIFVPWNGPHISGSVTGSTNAMIVATSSFADGVGIQFFEANPQMNDPQPEIVEHADKDANRFRKTYSYYRQQVVEVQVVKGGSNQTRS